MKAHLPIIIFAALAIIGLALAYPLASQGDVITVIDTNGQPHQVIVTPGVTPIMVNAARDYSSYGGYTHTVTKTTYGSHGGYSYGSSGGTATPTQVLPRPLPIVTRLRSLLVPRTTIIEVEPAATAKADCQCGCNCPGCKCNQAAKKEEPVTAKKQ